MISKIKLLIIIDIIVACLVVIILFIIKLQLNKTTPIEKSMSLKEYQDKYAMTGDLIFFASWSNVLKLTLNTKWNHVGVVIVDPHDNNNLYIWESNVIEDHELQVAGDFYPKDLFTNGFKSGTQFVNLKEKLQVYRGQYMIRSILYNNQSLYFEKNRFDENNYRLKQIFDTILDAKDWNFYDNKLYWFWMIAYEKTGIPVPPPESIFKKPQDTKTIFCSELVALFFQKLNIMKQHVYVRNVLPGHFNPRYAPFIGDKNSHNLFEKGWTLSEPFTLSLK